MKRRTWIWPLLVLCLLLQGCSIGPKNKTLLLREPASVPEETASAEGSFEIKKQYSVPLDKLDQSGEKHNPGAAVVDWMDNDNLLVLTAVDDAEGGAAGELGTLNCQYGFYNPIYRMDGQLPECVTLSPDRKIVSYQLENDEVGKYTVLLSLDMQRQVLSCDSFRVYTPPVWSKNSQSLAAASVVNGEYGLTLIDLSKGSTTKVLENRKEEIRVLDYLSEGTVLLQRKEEDWTAELLNTRDGASTALPAGEISQANCMSSTGVLALYGNTLRFVSPAPEGSQMVENYVQAYALTQNRLYAALALKNMDGSVDVAVGRWSGSHIINKKTVYKDIGDTVGRMLFSPDGLKLYIECGATGAGLPKTATVLEFS